MKRLLRVSLVGIGLSASVLAFSQSPVGTWNGRVDTSGMKPRNAQEQKAWPQMKKMIGGIKLKLTLKPNRTCTLAFTGGPGGQSQTETGKWSQVGRKITIKSTKGKPQTMTIGANGRTMLLVPNDPNAPKGMKMIFTKA